MSSLATFTADSIRDVRVRVRDAKISSEETALVDELRALEELKCAVEGRQARLAVALDTAQRERAAEAGEPVERHGRGVAAQIALARRMSHRKGQRALGLAKVLHAEMPHTLGALLDGAITEWRATLLARETACLETEQRARLDAELAADPDRLAAMGDRETADKARARAIELDNAAVARRRALAESERRVTIRPAPDAMVWLSALLPVAEGVAAYAALRKSADAAVAAGSETGRGRAMADELVARLTGARSVEGSRPTPSVSVQLTMPVDALVGDSSEPGQVDPIGPVPATLARALVCEALEDPGARVWLRRLFTRPTDGQLVAMDSRRRTVPAGLARFVRARDQRCRNPWCDAPARHIDHVVPAAEGGPTAAANTQGLCEACNHAKQAVGWTARVRGDTVEVVTPTGHVYASRPPPAGRRRSPGPIPHVELAWAA